MNPAQPLSLLQAARQGGYALGAFNAVNLETAQAIVRAAELERAPVILQISENAARYAGLEPLFAIGKVLKEQAAVPVVLHFDHAESLESAVQALELGFDSVMLESGSLEPWENARQLKLLSDLAHERGAHVEGEFEIVTKLGRAGETLPLEALRELVEASACDTVAIAIGSEHKMSQKTAQLDLERLGLIAAQVPQPLVLHGASGVLDSALQRAVRLGIAKVNLATELMSVFTQGVRSALLAGESNAGVSQADESHADESPGLEPRVYESPGIQSHSIESPGIKPPGRETHGSPDPRHYLGEARGAMQGAVQRLISLLGSSGRAR